MCPVEPSSEPSAGVGEPGGRILIVEDEPAIAESLEYALSRQGFDTRTAGSLESALAARHWAGLIVLDLMLPDGNGADLIRRIRRERLGTPVIVLSSRESEVDRVSALEDGADDYVTKPFSPREIVARVRAVLRRLPSDAPASQAVLTLDRGRREVRFAGRPLELTRVEFDLLSELESGRGRVYTRTELIDRVWGSGYAITDRTVDSHVKSLRKKLAEAGEADGLLETVRGVGYRLTSAAEAPTAAPERGAPPAARDGD